MDKRWLILRRRAGLCRVQRPEGRRALAHRSAPDGWVVEWFKAPVLKTGVGASPPWVRIPPHPPLLAHAPVRAPSRCAGAPRGRHSCRVALLPSPSGFVERSNPVPLSPVRRLPVPVTRILTGNSRLLGSGQRSRYTICDRGAQSKMSAMTPCSASSHRRTSSLTCSMSSSLRWWAPSASMRQRLNGSPTLG